MRRLEDFYFGAGGLGVVGIPIASGQENEVSADEQVNQGETFLQTRPRLYSLADVKKDPGPWIEAIKKEYQRLLHNKVIRVATEAEAKVLMEQARQHKKKVERIPGKRAFSCKSRFGRHKVRVVACGKLDGRPATVNRRFGQLCSWLMVSLQLDQKASEDPCSSLVGRGEAVVLHRDGTYLSATQSSWACCCFGKALWTSSS